MTAFEWPQERAWWQPGNLYVDRWGELTVDSIPFGLAKCPVCRALIESDDRDGHKAWHLTLGTSANHEALLALVAYADEQRQSVDSEHCTSWSEHDRSDREFTKLVEALNG